MNSFSEALKPTKRTKADYDLDFNEVDCISGVHLMTCIVGFGEFDEDAEGEISWQYQHTTQSGQQVWVDVAEPYQFDSSFENKYIVAKAYATASKMRVLVKRSAPLKVTTALYLFDVQTHSVELDPNFTYIGILQ